MSKPMMEKHPDTITAVNRACALAARDRDTYHVIFSRGAYYVENGSPMIRSWEQLLGSAVPTDTSTSRWRSR